MSVDLDFEKYKPALLQLDGGQLVDHVGYWRERAGTVASVEFYTFPQVGTEGL